jgi:hypothetical protein
VPPDYNAYTSHSPNIRKTVNCRAVDAQGDDTDSQSVPVLCEKLDEWRKQEGNARTASTRVIPPRNQGGEDICVVSEGRLNGGGTA